MLARRKLLKVFLLEKQKPAIGEVEDQCLAQYDFSAQSQGRTVYFSLEYPAAAEAAKAAVKTAGHRNETFLIEKEASELKVRFSNSASRLEKPETCTEKVSFTCWGAQMKTFLRILSGETAFVVVLSYLSGLPSDL